MSSYQDHVEIMIFLVCIATDTENPTVLSVDEWHGKWLQGYEKSVNCNEISSIVSSAAKHILNNLFMLQYYNTYREENIAFY